MREDVVHALHEAQIAEHGGGSGLRDQGLLESALARPQNIAAYGEPSAAELATAYLFGLAKNHPFVDGNKRTAAVCALLFLRLNGFDFTIGEAELVVLVLGVAAGELSEDDVTAWFAGHID
nr:type II toxin-antitoxin system death-on-curing family toxin [Novosphingopyxis sp. YJ-S2-01]